MRVISLFDIQPWEGSQHRAWEELAFQLQADPPSGVVETRKTRAPDGGVEWYYVFEDGHEEGYQAKFYADLASAIGDMGKSVKTVASQRPSMKRLTFVVPFDFTDQPGSKAKSDQRRWDEALLRWPTDIPGAERLSFAVIRGGEVLAELTRDEHAGRRAFWFGASELNFDLLERRWDEACKIAGQRYSPEAHTPVEIESDIHAVCLSFQFRDRVDGLVRAAYDDLLSAEPLTEAEPARFKSLAAELHQVYEAMCVDYPALSADPLIEIVTAAIGEVDRALASVRGDGSLWLKRHSLDQAESRLYALQSFLRSIGTRAAIDRSMAVIGPAGQGKTHSMLQAARDLLDRHVPALVLLGQRFDDGPWWPTMQAQLGGVGGSAEEFLGAFDAMAEATGQRGLIVIDALNESKRPESWRSELQSLRSYVAGLQSVSLILTWRDDYSEIIDAPAGLPTRRHRGLSGVETEALHRYCELFGISVPSVSIFDPAFSNPLFLRMFCEVRAQDPSAGDGSEGRSRVFARFAELRAANVRKQLQTSPSSSAVSEAIDLLADALIASGGASVPRAHIEPAIDALLPSRTEWPNTLFAVLRSSGLLETVPSWEDGELVTFPFQAFSEHLVVSRLLDQLAPGEAVLTETAAEAIRARPRFWRSAAVLLPERYGCELTDVLGNTDQQWRVGEVMLASFVDRDPSAFGERAFEMLESALADLNLTSEAHEALLTIAPRLDHPSGAEWLHARLLNIQMADRDASWGIGTFDVLDESAAYNRLLAWAVRGDSRSSDEQVVAACLPLAWSLISSNRRLRDWTSKVLVELFRGRLPALADLLRKFQTVDDPYVKERLLAVAYGSVVRGGDRDFAGATLLADEVHRWFTAGHVPVDVLARDSGRGVVGWAVHRDLLPPSCTAQVEPPYGASAPGEPETAANLEAKYGHTDAEPREWRAQSILSSCLDWMGDFNKYVIDGDVGYFSLHPLSGDPPSVRKHSDPLGEVEADWAGRWVAERAIQFGWTAERFEAFETTRDLTSGRDSHKLERFGKKYQWIALHELLARLADNFHPALDWNDEPATYAGPWPWFGRDIDPTLGAMAEVDGERASQVALDPAPGWIPVSPDLESGQTPDDWSNDISHFPEVEDLVSVNSDGAWIALDRHSEWSRRAEGERRWVWDRQQWLLLHSWLAKVGEGGRLFESLRHESLFGRRMPERSRPHRAYLGEGPWSPIQKAEPATWEPAWIRSGDLGVDVLPATEAYLWEGNTLDCSIDVTLSFNVPIAALLGEARWEGTDPSWLDGETVVAKALRSPEAIGQHSVLLIAAAWLENRLRELELELVVGVLGERQATDTGGDASIRAWTELTSVGLWVPGQPWRFTGPRAESHTRGDE
jgi:hypothetical protein